MHLRWILGLTLVVSALPVLAFTIAITPGTRALYLQVGAGSFTGNYNTGGTPLNNSTVNVVSVVVPANAVGTGGPRVMTTNSTQANSYWDGYAFCNVPAQIYIGGFFRQPGVTGTAVLSATSPATLQTASGSTMPFSQISWTSSGNGDTGAQPIPAGTFNGATQTLTSFGANSWNESCHTFSYANAAVVGAGVYSGRVTYTLSAP